MYDPGRFFMFPLIVGRPIRTNCTTGIRLQVHEHTSVSRPNVRIRDRVLLKARHARGDLLHASMHSGMSEAVCRE